MEDGALSEECSFSVSAGTYQAVSTLSSSEEIRGMFSSNVSDITVA